ncbi:MAG: hypothetical protein ABI640_07705 [Gammaproteobacteria bacterium]
MATRHAFTVAAFAALLAGCAAEAPLKSTLDEKGRTWVSADALVTLASATPNLSNAARDYLYLAPIEINTTGVRRHYLWVGLGSTVDRKWQSSVPANATSVVLAPDGLNVTLPLTAWDAELPLSMYSTPAPVYQMQRAPISLDQLERLARAGAVEVLVVAADGSTATYTLWNGAWAAWEPFVRQSETTMGATADHRATRVDDNQAGRWRRSSSSTTSLSDSSRISSKSRRW